MRNLKNKWFILILLTVFGTGYFTVKKYQRSEELKLAEDIRDYVKAAVSQQVVSEDTFPERIKYKDLDVFVSYTLNEKFQNGLEGILKRYPNDYTAIVVMDNNTGKLLALGGISRKDRKVNFSLPFSSTHPSASLFKIVTTADLLENNLIEPSTRLNYRGRGTTLYKYQLKNKVSRWTRWISFKKAFAYSNNVIFGKAAIQKTSGQSIFKTAFSFGFNRQLMVNFNLGPSRFIMPESQYHLAELASGFNKQTLISPIHAAVLSSVVANQGYLKRPQIIEGYTYEKNQVDVVPKTEKVLEEQTVEDLSQMMELTVKKGTARGISRGREGRRLKNQFVIGAKTGSITGGIPYGKREWLTFYARPKDEEEDRGISVAIMNINGDKWYYKSSYMAKRVLKLYRELKEDDKVVFRRIDKSEDKS